MSTKKSLHFNGIFDLINKVEKIKKAHELVCSLYKHELLENGIPFTEIGDFGVCINYDKIPKGKESFLKNDFQYIIDAVYEQVGVIDFYK